MTKVERVTQPHPARLLLALWMLVAALCSSACTEAPTQIVVVVDPDPGVQTRLTAVQVTLRRNGEVSTFDAGRYEIPQHLLQTSPQDGHLVLRPRDLADARSVVVTVTGLLRDGSRVSYATATRFERAKTLYLHAPLVSACARVSECPGATTCREGSCVPVQEQRLAETPPASTRDAASTDTTAVDSAAMDHTQDDAPMASDVLSEGGGAADADRDVGVEDATVGDAAVLDATDDAPDVLVDSASLDSPEDRMEVVDAGVDVATDVPVADVDPMTVPAPRLVAPLSTAIVTQRSPRFQWRGAPEIDAVELQVCRDRACTMVHDRVVQPQGAAIREDIRETLPSADLPAGNWFWRMRGRWLGVPGAAWSEVRQVRVPVRSAAHYAVGPTEDDLNGDGMNDVVVDAQILWGTSTGLTSGAIQTLPSTGSVAVPGDLNQDGIVDLVAGRNGSEFRIWWGSTSAMGLSVTPARVTAPPAPEPLLDPSRAGDVNADGFADLAVGNFRMSHLMVFAGDARSGLTYTATLEASVPNLAAPPDTAGDFDGDGYADLVVTGQGGNLCRVYFGGADGVQSSRFLDLATGAPMELALSGETNPVGDVDGDGYFDVSCGAQTTVSLRRWTQCVYFGGPTRSVTRSRCLDLFASSGSSSYSDGADFDRDGFNDVVLAVVNPPRLILGIYYGSATGLAATPGRMISLPASMDGWAFVRAEDFNGDGRPDLFLNTSREGSFYFQNTAIGFSDTPTRTFPGLAGPYFAEGRRRRAPRRERRLVLARRGG